MHWYPHIIIFMNSTFHFYKKRTNREQLGQELKTNLWVFYKSIQIHFHLYFLLVLCSDGGSHNSDLETLREHKLSEIWLWLCSVVDCYGCVHSATLSSEMTDLPISWGLLSLLATNKSSPFLNSHFLWKFTLTYCVLSFWLVNRGIFSLMVRRIMTAPPKVSIPWSSELCYGIWQKRIKVSG